MAPAADHRGMAGVMRVALALALLAAMAGPAAADPTGGLLTAFIINVGLGAGISVGTGAAIAAVAVPLITVGAAVGLQFLLTTRPSLPSPGDGSQSVQQPIPPRIYGVGIATPAIAILLLRTVGGNLVQVCAIMDGQIDGVEQFLLSGDPVTVDESGLVTSAPRGGYVPNKVRLQTAFGQHGLVPFNLVSLFGSEFATFYGSGISFLYMFCGASDSEHFPSDYPNGKPNPGGAFRMARVWDPRVAAQSYSDPSTWTFTKNAALCWLWYECFCEHGPQRDVATAILPVIDDWKTAADICDEDMPTLAGGTVKRYEIGYWWTSDATRESVRGMFAAACDGTLFDIPDGTCVLKVGKYIDSGVVLTDEDIVGYMIKGGNAVEDRVNMLSVKFTDPANLYGAVEADPIMDEDQIALDGQVVSQSIDLWQVQTLNQAKRLALIGWKRTNEPLTGSLTLNIGAARIKGERWVRVQSARVSKLADEVIEIKRLSEDPVSSLITIEFVRSGAWLYDYDPSDPIFGDGETPPAAEEISSPPPVPAHLGGRTVSDGSTVGFHFEISCDDPGRTDLGYVLQSRIADDGTGNPGTWMRQEFSNSAAVLSAGRATISIYPAESHVYEVQMAFKGAGGGFSAWSGSLLIGPDGAVGSLDFSQSAQGGYFTLLEDV